MVDAIRIVHLVKLVNADDASVGKHHRTGLQVPVASVFVNSHGGSETNTCL